MIRRHEGTKGDAVTEQAPGTGSIGWVDLTVGDATRIRDFYASVAGWRPEAVEMGEYALPDDDEGDD